MSPCRRRKGDPYLLLSAGISSKWIKELNIRFERTRWKHTWNTSGHRHGQGERASSSCGLLLLFQITIVLQYLHGLFIESKFLLIEDSPFSCYIFPEYAIMDAWVSSLTTWSISAHPSNVSFHLIFFRTPLQSHSLLCTGSYQMLLLLLLAVLFSFKFLLAWCSWKAEYLFCPNVPYHHFLFPLAPSSHICFLNYL